MATKKPTKTPATDDSQPNAPAQAAKARPFAESPAPEHCRVDPESAATEYMKSLLPPDAPLPVFSTMALMHGQKAFAADKVRPGFAWNPQMDLLWALGFPEVRLVVDGFPEADGRDAARRAGMGQELMLGRRAVHSVLIRHTTKKNPADFSEKRYLLATEPRELRDAEVTTLLTRTDETYLEDVILWTEALIGPSRTMEHLFGLLSSEDDTRHFEAISTFPRIRRRLRRTEASAAMKRLSTIKLTGDNGDYVRKLVTPPDAAALDLHDLTLRDEDPKLTLRAARAEHQAHKFRCLVRSAFTGPDEVLKVMAERFSVYSSNGPDIESDYLEQLTTLATEKLLACELQLLTRKTTRREMKTWFDAHKTQLASPLKRLARQPKYAKIAKDLIAR